MQYHKKEHKPTILQILPALNSGGVERGTIEIAQAISENNMQSIVSSNGGRLVSKLIELNIKHLHLPLHSKNPLVMYRNIKLLTGIIKEHGINLLHARSRAPAWSGYYAAKKAGIPFVTTFHGLYGNNLFKKHYNQIMVKSDAIIAVSNYIKAHIVELYPEVESKITVIHRGIDPAYFNANRITKQMQEIVLAKLGIHYDVSNKSLIMLPGRISNWKGQEIFIEALSYLKEQDFLGIIIGENHHPRYQEKLKKLVADYKLENKIIFADPLKDMPSLYSIADLVVVPSIKGEAFGRVAIEAQSMGKIVIASNVGGCVETIIDGKTGLLFENKNPIDFAEKINHALNLSKHEKELIAKNARQHVIENFNLKNMQEQTINVYNNLLGLNVT
ncbi:glycosyltransferase family 4 protein [Rickettsiales endosymbiont of Stachyamoeba lipophora]|uniref:glycosyltransferase family 4 protein n=1 Tax=Rickettsiales endosymbiont of Stachyamoeba lipophora TaxID=2486578 RepID=UPI000F655AF3|nr:glycosyltransferase family 4 protein [Rickettsiales endosymbiont of Stachyamoeba lipophora]AZL15679.1 glycosyltransferase [Rickettsiales endosymbiont of Stachyamoeba lipophora]